MSSLKMLFLCCCLLLLIPAYGLRQPHSSNIENRISPKSRHRSLYDYGDHDYDRKKAVEDVTYPSFTRRTKLSVTTNSPSGSTFSFASRPRLLDELHSFFTPDWRTMPDKSEGLLTGEHQQDVSLDITSTTTIPSQLTITTQSDAVKLKVIRIEIRVPSTENAGTDSFKRILASRLSFILSMLQSLEGIDSFLLGKQYPSEPYTSDILVFRADRVNETATDRVSVDFVPVLNSTMVDAGTVASLMQFRFPAGNLAQLLGYTVVGLPKAIPRTVYDAGSTINQILRIEFQNFGEQNDAFYFVVNKWLNDFVVPLACNLTNVTGELASVMITRVSSNANITTVDFSLNLGHPSTASPVAKQLFSTSPFKLQSMIDFTIISAGYLLINGAKQLYVPLYNRHDDYYLPTSKVELETTLPPVNSTSSPTTLETDQLVRMVFNVSADNSKKGNAEKEIRNWVNTFIVAFVKSALNTTFNASALFFNLNFLNRTVTLDFAIIFLYQQFPLATKASELVRVLFTENFDKIQATSPFPVISGGHLVYGKTNTTYIIAVYSNVAPTATTLTIKFKRVDPSASFTSATTSIDAAVTNATLFTTTAAETTNISVFQDDSGITQSARSSTTPTTTTTSFSPDTDQIARITFYLPEDGTTSPADSEKAARHWLDSYVAPLIQSTFGANYSVQLFVIKSVTQNRQLSLDFAVFFVGKSTMVTNATELAVELFSTSFAKIKTTTPLKIASGGYLLPKANHTSLYIVVYSSTGITAWSKPTYTVANILQMDIRVPIAVDSKSNTFKELITNRLRGAVFPILQQPDVSDSTLFANSVKYSTDPNVFDVFVTDASRLSSDDKEKVTVQFVIVDNSSLLNAETAATALALNMETEPFQRAIGFPVLTFPAAVTSIKEAPIKEPESQLWIIAAVLVPVVVVIILINICILSCCRPGKQPIKRQGDIGLPPAPTAETFPQDQQSSVPPFYYYYQPYVVPTAEQTKQIQVEQPSSSADAKVSAHLIEPAPLASPAASLPVISPQPLITYHLMASSLPKRTIRSRARTRRRIRPIEHQDAAVISQVASSLLREALRNLSVDELDRIRNNTQRGLATVNDETGEIVNVTDSVCQTEDAGKEQQLGKEAKPWTREYEQSLLRLASLVISPSGVEVASKQAPSPMHHYTTLPEHGEIIGQALKSTAKLATPMDPVLPPIVAEEKAPANEQQADYLNIDDSQMKQLERLNSLFLGIPPVNAEVTRLSPVKRDQLGAKPGEFADEHDVIVDSLKPGVPPRRLLEAIRAELENYGKKQ